MSKRSAARRAGAAATAVWLRPAALLCLGLSVAVGTLVGCAGPATEVASKKQQLLWPAWPDQPRFAFEAVLGTEASIVAETKDQRLQKMLTGVEKSSQARIDNYPQRLEVNLVKEDGHWRIAAYKLLPIMQPQASRGR